MNGVEREKDALVVGRERICMSGRMSDGTGLGLFLKIDYLHRKALSQSLAL